MQENIAPSLNIPPSSNICEISIVNTTCDILVTSSALLEPVIKGHEFLNLPTYAFYIYNRQLNKRLLYDMGSRKDWWNFPPAVLNSLRSKGIPGIRVSSDIDEILTDGGIDPHSIDAVVWSHFHWDHIGNIQKFPKSTELIVGSGFRNTYLPGYPTNPNAVFYDADFEGRALNEISFDEKSLRIGKLRAHDYFGDGSLYILSTPGHTAGHISGLVRTTPDTFVFLGGDISHFPGMYRPSQYTPMPDTLPQETELGSRFPVPCPCSLFTACHPAGPAHAQNSPFYKPASNPLSWYDDPIEALKSVQGLIEFDASGDVLVAIAHDPVLQDVCTMFPFGTMNDWKTKGWKQQVHWRFVRELPINGEPGRPKIVDGRLKHGVALE